MPLYSGRVKQPTKADQPYTKGDQFVIKDEKLKAEDSANILDDLPQF